MDGLLNNKLYEVFVCVRVAENCSCTWISKSKTHFANCTALAAVLFTTLIENLRLCSSAEAGLLLICF